MINTKKFKFSIIIPIYNVEEYLEETILSVINQSIGFKDNVQMILVNDGSPDNSHLICNKYKELYPDNIIYIEQENGGVSSARNNGMKYIRGEIVNFLDSDDKWELNAFEKAWKFFEKNYESIDVVACRLNYFEAKTGFSHPLNFKFTKDFVVDIRYFADYIQMHMASCFIKASALNVKFNSELKFGEDSLFINEIILNKRKYGVMKSINYMYRKRANESSAIDTCKEKHDFYNKTLVNFHNKIIQDSKNLFGEVIPYVQHLVMYDLQWRLKRETPEGVLTEEEQKTYENHLVNIVKEIDDIIILNQKNIWNEHKVFAFNLKYGFDITHKYKQIKSDFYFNNLKIFSMSNKSLLKLSQIKVNNNILHLEGIINTTIDKDLYKIFINDELGNEYLLENIVDYVKREKVSVYGHFFYDRFFKIDIPLKEKGISKFIFKFQYKDNYPVTISLDFLDSCKLNTCTGKGFLKLDNNLIEFKKNQLIVRNKSRKIHLENELKIQKFLWKRGLKKLVIYRLVAFILKYLIKKEIWLISDRPDKAGDNGEAFFKYMQTHKDKNILTYFVISKSSEDWEKMKKIGKVLNRDSIFYRLMFLLSSKIISSQASDYVINPFRNQKQYLKDLYTFKFVFLQHGIIKDDLSTWLNKVSKPMDIFVTSGMPEYESVSQGNYYYGKEIVKLTGLPRHDYLFSNEKKKQIVIIPTWRKSIKGCTDANDKSIYNETFNESDFFKFYNSLINDEKLLESMNKYGYTGLFCLHPLFTAQYPHFKENEIFKVNKGFVDYNKIFTESSLLVTDYSSVFFDFAYLNKPVLYAHFDKEDFFKGHSYDQGYFSYEEDGFGEVSYTLEETVNNIIKYIKNECVIDNQYKERINSFYPKERGQNCENVLNEIKKLNR